MKGFTLIMVVPGIKQSWFTYAESKANANLNPLDPLIESITRVTSECIASLVKCLNLGKGLCWVTKTVFTSA